MNTKLAKDQKLNISLGQKTVRGIVNGFQEGFASRPGVWLVTLLDELSDRFVKQGTFTVNSLIQEGAAIEEV